jgi:hypothetical protein
MLDAPAAASPTVSWLTPIITVSIGFAFGILTEWFRDARAYRREREARSDARAETKAEQRRDFQRQSLIALQDAICELIADLRLHVGEKSAVVLEGKDWNEAVASKEVAIKSMISRDRVVTLRARVSDDLTRRLTQAVLVACASTVRAKSKEGVFEGLEKMKEGLEGVSERIGIMLRTLDDFVSAPKFEDAKK